MTIPAIGFDLDSTIANTLHRQWMVPLIVAGGPAAPTWDDYSMGCANDVPIAGTVALMRALCATYRIIVITGRADITRELTLDWFTKHLIPWDVLLMRPAGDRTANGKYKVQMINRVHAESQMRIELFVEDWAEAASYITEHTRIPCLLVNANYPARAPHSNENTGSA